MHRSGRHDIPQPLQGGPDQRGAPVSLINELHGFWQRQAFGRNAVLQCGDLACDCMGLGLLV
jgi:hypothetical protein